MKVLFIFTREIPQSPVKPLVDLETMQFGISFISSYLKQNGHQTQLLVLTRQSEFGLIDKHIQRFNPDIVGFTTVATEYPFVERIARYIKKQFTHPFLLAGGPHISLAPENAMLDIFDGICIGEGEDATLELAEQLGAGRQPDGIANLWLRKGASIQKNPLRPFIADLDALPYPDRDMWYPWIDFSASQLRPSLLLGRGCPYDCTYCSNHALSRLATGQYVRVRSTKNIIGEVEQLVATFPDMKGIYFEVETFCAKKDWSLELCGELERFNSRRARPLAFGVNIRVSQNLIRQHMDKYFATLKRAGFCSVNIGLESGSTRVRKDLLHRSYSNDDLFKVVTAAKRQGIEVVFFNLIGLPLETLEDFHETVWVNALAQPNWHYLSIFFPYPGTRLYEICRQTTELPERFLDQGMERVKAILDFPDFSRAQIQKAFIWFDYYVYRNNRALDFLADHLLYKYRLVHGCNNAGLADIIANDILDPALKFDVRYHPDILIPYLVKRLPQLEQAFSHHPEVVKINTILLPQPEPIELLECSINLGEVHCLTSHGYFLPVFHCRTNQGEEFVARMKLLVTESLEELLFLDPRSFTDGGMEANSSDSPFIPTRAGHAVRGTSSFTNAPSSVRWFRVTGEQINAVLCKRLDLLPPDVPLRDPRSIAFTCHDPNVVGGGNIILFRLINWLADLGVKVTVYSCGRPPTWGRVQAAFRCFDNYSEMFQAIDEQVIILFSMWHIEAMLRSNTSGKRVYHLRQIFEPRHYGTDYVSLMERKPIIELLESVPIGCITIAPHLQEWYRERLGIESLLITNGVDLRNFRYGTAARENLPVKRVLSVGDPGHSVKGVRILADALILLARRRTDIKFSWTIVSHRGETRTLTAEMERASIDVRQCAVRNHADMARFYHEADIFVNPSLYEGFGLPTLEAMACGVPVVHADNCGLDKIVSDGRDCLVVAINDPVAMAHAIERLLDGPQLAECLRQGGLETARRHSVLNQFGMFVPAFERILGAPFDSELVARLQSTFSAHEQPLVSVVIPSYNQAEFLPETLESIMAQTYQNWEAIIVNDGSSDNTEEVMATYADRDPRIRHFSKPNGGISSALNEGIRQARGEYFCWLSSDDLFYPEKLALQVDAFARLGDNYALMYGSFDLLQNDTGKLDIRPFAAPIMAGAEFPEALKFDFIDGCTIMIRMNVLREIGGFNSTYRHSQDLELWMRLASRGYRFHLLHKKLTIRRIHVGQSSTNNSIYCRYDAAWMINYYLNHFHLLEMYRFFEFTSEKGIEIFLEHFVGRMLDTEANINNPLIQEKFWRWFLRGLKAIPVYIQLAVLKKCFVLLVRHRADTPKMEYYISSCLNAQLELAVHVPATLTHTVTGRDIRNNSREDDYFGTEIFDFGTDLFVNTHTHLFAQQMYLHNTNKMVDTPYKMGHSAIRYLSQFPNGYRERVMPYSEMVLIPQNDEEALELFCHLRYPREAELLISHARAVKSPEQSDQLDQLEARIAQLPQGITRDLVYVCSKHPTQKLLYYWLALACGGAGDIKRAARCGLSALGLAREYGNGVMAGRIGEWCEKSCDFANGRLAHACSLSLRPSNATAKEAFGRLTSSLSQGPIRTVPTPKAFITKTKKPDSPSLIIERFHIHPQINGTAILELAFKDGPKGQFAVAYEQPLEKIDINDTINNRQISVTSSDLFEYLNNGYNFMQEDIEFITRCSRGEYRPSVAFTLLSSSVLGGGPSIVYRFANWLTELGVAVTIYSNDSAPSWIGLKCRLVTITDDAKRYAAITEPVVIFYSILEIQKLLRFCDTRGRRIYHMCQGVEDFNYHGAEYPSIIARKQVFELLHSLPVGRISISQHVNEHFGREYRQSTHMIVNGINRNVFWPSIRRPRKNEITVMTTGNPNRVLKGARDLMASMGILKNQYPHVLMKLVIVSGEVINNMDAFNTSSYGFETSVVCKLRQEDMQKCYNQTDVYVNAAWYEGFGLPSLEAMACGVPVVQADNQGLNGVIRNKENCILVPPADPAAMAEAIKHVLTDESVRSRMVTNGLNTAKEYSIARQYRMFVDEFQTILACRFDEYQTAQKISELEQGSLDERLHHLKSLRA